MGEHLPSLGEKVMSSGLHTAGMKTYVTSSYSSHIGGCIYGSKAHKGFWNEHKLGTQRHRERNACHGNGELQSEHPKW